MGSEMIYGKTQQLRDMLFEMKKHSTGAMEFKGSVKLHGTNAGVRFENVKSSTGNMTMTQITGMSRSSLLDATDKNKKHMGFAQFVDDKAPKLHQLYKNFCDLHVDLPNGSKLEIFGEWVGKGVLKGCAIHKMPTKRWFVFGASVTLADGSVSWYDTEFLDCGEDDLIINIYDFGCFTVIVDPNDPEPARSVLEVLVSRVERQCPVALEYGCVGIGEGLVYSHIFEGKKAMFKTKGMEHKIASTKQKVNIAPEIVAGGEKFAAYAVTLNRVTQAMANLQANDRSFTGRVLQAVAKDVLDEESDVLAESGLTWKQVANFVNSAAREIFFTELEK